MVTGLPGPGTPVNVHSNARFPFGSPLRSVVQGDRSPKTVFVLGVYASAVHAKWIGPSGRVLVKALAVASEPTIFWNGAGADALVAGLDIPRAAGHLVPAEPRYNGPSGGCLDEDFLVPLGLKRAEIWLCDLVPHACQNEQQRAAIGLKYEPRRAALGLPAVTIPPVPPVLADDQRRAEILAEIEIARPEVLVVLGDEPVRHFLAHHDRRWSKLSDFGEGEAYGRLHEAVVGARKLHVLALAHPRQVGALGLHSPKWRKMHRAWRAEVAPGLLARGFAP